MFSFFFFGSVCVKQMLGMKATELLDFYIKFSAVYHNRFLNRKNVKTATEGAKWTGRKRENEGNQWNQQPKWRNFTPLQFVRTSISTKPIKMHIFSRTAMTLLGAFFYKCIRPFPCNIFQRPEMYVSADGKWKMNKYVNLELENCRNSERCRWRSTGSWLNRKHSTNDQWMQFFQHNWVWLVVFNYVTVD